jgi:hypothetical protein
VPPTVSGHSAGIALPYAPEQAREVLAEVCSWFREGLDAPDLKDAKDLLEELS